MEDWPTTDKLYNLWWKIDLMWRAFHKARRKELSRYGITIEEASVLVTIDAIGSNATPLEISRWILREPHSTSELISRMEKKGLLNKTRDLKNKSQVRTTITDKGYEALQMVSKGQSVHHILSSSLSNEEREQFDTLVKKIWASSLEELGRQKMYEMPSFPPLLRRVAAGATSQFPYYGPITPLTLPTGMSETKPPNRHQVKTVENIKPRQENRKDDYEDSSCLSDESKPKNRSK
jgi:DNA-binding MarR family transcriptional regulator